LKKILKFYFYKRLSVDLLKKVKQKGFEKKSKFTKKRKIC